MEPEELKESRKILGADQTKMAELLGVAMRTYQNWEQSREKKNYRQIPKDAAEKVRSLVTFRKRSGGAYLPKEIIWLPVPLLPQELEFLENKAKIEGLDNAVEMIRQLISNSIY